MSKETVRVVDFPVSSLADIAAGLRALADRVEADCPIEGLGNPNMLVWASLSDSGVEVGALGRESGDPVRAIGLLSSAAQRLSMIQFEASRS